MALARYWFNAVLVEALGSCGGGRSGRSQSCVQRQVAQYRADGDDAPTP